MNKRKITSVTSAVIEGTCSLCFGKGKTSGTLFDEVTCSKCNGSGRTNLVIGRKYHCGFHNETFLLTEKSWKRHSIYPPCLPMETVKA